MKTAPKLLSRRTFLTTGMCAALAGCASPRYVYAPRPDWSSSQSYEQDYAYIYGPRPDELFPIPAVDLSKVDSRFYRRRVSYRTDERPGTIIVDTPAFYLYLVEEGGTAMRYGVGLGRAGFEWAGRARVGWKQKWPTWTPPAEMIEREPELEKWSADNGGMPPGLDNPLGSRAIYIFQDGEDTLYRIHGTPEVHTIGQSVSSGCVRMINQDVIDLYERVENGAPIVVRDAASPYV